MVRLPDVEGEWETHTHTSGRVFLTNVSTKETRWLWQKWDANGRMFVRNAVDPRLQIWVDRMDEATRLQTGTASPDEIARYQASQAYTPHPYAPNQVVPPSQPPLPPPPPPPPHRFPPPPPPPPPPPTSSSQPFYSLSPPLTSAPLYPLVSQLSYSPNSSHPYSPSRKDSDTYGRATSEAEATHYDPSSRSRYDQFPSRNHNGYPHLPHVNGYSNRQPFVPSSHNPTFDSDPLRAAPPFARKPYPSTRGRKRAQQGDRYWNYNDHSKKRTKPSYDETVKRQVSRGPVVFQAPRSQPFPPRPKPSPILPSALSGDRYASYLPYSTAAKAIWSACRVQNPTVGLLHDRDFRIRETNHSSPNHVHSVADPDDESRFEPIVGTSQNIEKEYLRLTSAPKPEEVRPPGVLVKALAHIKASWYRSLQDYDWVCRQIKAVRQDYKVQHISSSDVVDVYQTHARIALANNDLGEFNTCVAQLQELFDKIEVNHHIQDEFLAYRIVYNIIVQAPEWEQAKMLSKLSSTERNRVATRTALQVRDLVITGNYNKFFKICSNPPKNTMLSFLFTHLYDRMRFHALSAMANAYGSVPKALVPSLHIMKLLGWLSNSERDGSEETVNLKDFISSEDEKILTQLSSLNIMSERRWVYEALLFLLNANVTLIKDDSVDEQDTVKGLLVDFTATKSQGLRRPKATTKLITHAGTDSVDLLK